MGIELSCGSVAGRIVGGLQSEVSRKPGALVSPRVAPVQDGHATRP
ncbi:MAG TPA: hypothetical protein VK816_07865 [Jatrophihabitantaceae bacterium]|nr:hypothetical protein [Jatrophihabitantaceae bacterium]